MYCTNGAIRLDVSSGIQKGRVEVCIDETWHKICAHRWTAQEASVVCSQLGYSPYGMMCTVNMTYYSYIILGAMATTANLYIDYELPVGIINLQCHGNESKMWNCSYDTTHVFVRRCSLYYNDASVFCMCMLCLIILHIFHYF